MGRFLFIIAKGYAQIKKSCCSKRAPPACVQKLAFSWDLWYIHYTKILAITYSAEGRPRHDRRHLRPLFLRQSTGGIHRRPDPRVYRLRREEWHDSGQALYRPGLFSQDSQPPGISADGKGQRETLVRCGPGLEDRPLCPGPLRCRPLQAHSAKKPCATGVGD